MFYANCSFASASRSEVGGRKARTVKTLLVPSVSEGNTRTLLVRLIIKGTREGDLLFLRNKSPIRPEGQLAKRERLKPRTQGKIRDDCDIMNTTK